MAGKEGNGSGAAASQPPSSTTNGNPRPSLVIPSIQTLLLVMHDFQARSPDELTLRKGEHVEVLEKDDEFGDGWYLGRSTTTGEQGLFPQVYTSSTVVNKVSESPAEITPSPTAPSSTKPSTAATIATAPTTTPQSTATIAAKPEQQPSEAPLPNTHSSSSSISAPEDEGEHLPTPPLSVEKVTSGRSTPTPGDPPQRRSVILAQNSLEGSTKAYPSGLRSPVVEDTLTDIDEAITEISNSQINRTSKIMSERNRRHSSVSTMGKPVFNHHTAHTHEVLDSSSEYSRQGQESDSEIEDDDDSQGIPEDEAIYTEADVKSWTPSDVSQYLESRGITPSTCEKFEEQEVSGSILLQLEMAHLKELEIGSFGRRFEVWKEIEHLVNNIKAHARPKTKPRSGSDTRTLSVNFAKDASGRQRSSTIGPSVLPRVQSQRNRPVSRQYTINVQEANEHEPNKGPMPTPGTATTIASSVASEPSIFEDPRSPPISPSRHGRYTSSESTSTSVGLKAAMSAGNAVLAAVGIDAQSTHSRDGSFDKSWSSAILGASISRPTTAPGTRSGTTNGAGDNMATGNSRSQPQAPKGNERSYFSSGESGPKERERKVLHKKNSGHHSRKPSYTEEQRLRTGTAHTRHSRISSAEATRKTSSGTLSAAQAYHIRGSGKEKKRKSASFSAGVTDGFPYDASAAVSSSTDSKFKDPARKATGNPSTSRTTSPGPPILPPLFSQSSRSISESFKDNKPTSPLSLGSRSLESADGSSPSLTATAESDPTINGQDRSPKAERSHTAPSRLRAVSSGSGLRHRSKRHTSAFVKGLRDISPAEAAKDADWSGWMKKRGSSGIGAWKNRFFVLKGRRLAYWYSEDDTKERGLIDITSHRVLPANEEFLVSLHASLAAVTSPGAGNSPNPGYGSPNGKSVGSTPTSPPGKEKEKDKKEREKEKDKKEKEDKEERDKHWFTFKLVPPAPGASKGVTFTPPRLHYFATDTREEGKKWMGAMMKATIDRDESKPVISSYQANTISLAKARELKARPPGLVKNGQGLAIEGVELGIEEGDEADVEDGGEGSVKTEGVQKDPTPKKEKDVVMEGPVKVTQIGIV